MKKRIVAILLLIIMLLGVGCGKKKDTETTPTVATETTETTQPTEATKPKVTKYTNPLTGVKDLDKKEDANNRPVAIMINNLSSAQRVQTGVNKADIVYETEVEGGITRLLAVYQDVSKVKRIGTVRSARYAYVDLAMGHNAIYVHHGADNVYAGPHLRDVDRMEISPGRYAERISNGLAYEHTLYTTSGESLWNGIKSSFNTTKSDSSPWQKFKKKVKLTGGDANSVSIPFSNSYVTKFVYDKKSGTYIRNFAGVERTDYYTKEKTKMKNVVVLLTSIGNYPNGKHKNISLSSGSGYYISNGKYQKINWSKGSASSSFSFTNTDGSPLEMNAGKTWVCIASSSYSQPYFG